jgi:hypothetical protein
MGKNDNRDTCTEKDCCVRTRSVYCVERQTAVFVIQQGDTSLPGITADALLITLSFTCKPTHVYWPRCTRWIKSRKSVSESSLLDSRTDGLMNYLETGCHSTLICISSTQMVVDERH